MPTRPSKFRKLSRQFAIGFERLAQLHEGAHDRDVHLHGALAFEHARKHGDALLGEGVGQMARPATPIFEMPIWHFKLSASLSRELKHEIGRKTVAIASDRLVQMTGRNAVKSGQIEHRAMTFCPRSTRMVCAIHVSGNDLFAHSVASQANSRAIWTTVVLKMLKTNCGAMPMANMSSVTGTNDQLLVPPEIGESVTTLRERPAEERLHRAQEDDGGEEQAEHGHGGKRRRDGEGAFEDQELADESVQAGQA